MNEIAVIEQLPIITERIKEIGEQLTKRLVNLNLEKLVCNEETRKEIKNLRTELGKELKEFESQRKAIKNKINEPYDEFNKTYESLIKSKYEEADVILKNKIDVVETGIKNNAKILAVEFFEEYKKSKSEIEEDYITFEELNIQLGLDSLTEKGLLVKKVKDAITDKIDSLERDIETINTMQDSKEILVEYLKHKNLSLAIKEINDRHAALEQIRERQEMAKERRAEEERTVQKVEEVLVAPKAEVIDGQISIDDFADTQEMGRVEEEFEMTFTVKGTLTKLKELKKYLIEEGFINE